MDEQGYLGADRNGTARPQDKTGAPCRKPRSIATGHQPRRRIVLLDGSLPRTGASPGLPHLGGGNTRDRGTQLRRTKTLPTDVESPAAAAREKRAFQPSLHFKLAGSISSRSLS